MVEYEQYCYSHTPSDLTSFSAVANSLPIESPCQAELQRNPNADASERPWLLALGIDTASGAFYRSLGTAWQQIIKMPSPTRGAEGLPLQAKRRLLFPWHDSAGEDDALI